MMKYAGNQLFGLGEERFTLAMVEIDSQSHILSAYAPMREGEEPFTQWLGGTFILSERKELPQTKVRQTLDWWIEKLTADLTTKERVLYVWHTPETNLNNSVSYLTRL